MPEAIIKNNATKPYMQKWRSFALVAVLLLAAVFYDLSTVGGGNNLRLYVKWATCGSWPVESVGRVAGEVSSYQSAQGFAIAFRGGAEYFCTPLEAEKAGYSASSHQDQFPNLRAEEQKR